MAFPTYTSAIAQILQVVEHSDGLQQTYVFSAGGTYTPVSQEEAWIFEYLAIAYGLTLPVGLGYGVDPYGLGAYGA